MGLKTLVAMQLKDKLDLSYLKSTKQTIFKVVFSLLEFAIITAIIFLAFYILSYLRLTSLSEGIATNFFSIIFSFMIVLSVIVCSFGLAKSLYLAKDNQVLLTMPTSRVSVFLSKLIVYVIYEFKRNLTYILPLLFAYGLINNMSFLYFLWLLPAILIITLLTTSIGALFSIPTLFLLLAIKKHNYLGYILLTVFVVAVSLLAVYFISLIPTDIDLVGNWGTIFWQIQDFFENFVKNFSIFYYLTVAFVGIRYGIANQFFIVEQVLSLLVILAIILVVLSLTILIVKPLFFKMASKPFEYTKDTNKKASKNKVLSVFSGGVKKELVTTFRSSEKLSGILLTTIILPIAILLLNKIFGAMNTRLSGTYMTMAFNILIILLVALSSNSVIAKIFSEEGQTAYINKTSPVEYQKILSSKLVINLVFINLSILASTIIFGVFSKFSFINIFTLFLSISMIYSGHLFFSASLDIMKPQIEQYTTTGTHTNNPNETKSLLFSFLISAIVAFVFFFLISENIKLVWTKILIISTIYFAYNLYMYLTKIKVYYKEK